jgi:putative endonuclease
MIKPNTHQLYIGKIGEDAATEWLIKQNFKILARNWRFGRAEIDIIAQNSEQTIVFVEVKTRTDNTFAQPQIAVSLRKQQLICEAAFAFLNQIKHNWTFRFDIIAILFKNETSYIQHFEDAFFPAL